jgi:hypothetical protein
VSHIDPALARRIDRLARRAHRFHRFAHHPLCAPYSMEVVRIGRRVRVCKGCALAVAGALAGGIAGLLAPPLPPARLAALLACAAPLVLLVAAPRRGRPQPKLLTRALPAAVAGALAAAGLRGAAPGLGVTAATIAASVLAARAYRRRGPDRSACQDCSERTAQRACAGFRPHARREAAFARLAGRWIAAEMRTRTAAGAIGGAPAAAPSAHALAAARGPPPSRL